MECVMGSESDAWEVMDGGVVWCGVNEEGKGQHS